MARDRWAALDIDEAEAASAVPLVNLIEPTEVASLVYYLASEEAGATTGTAFNIDAGVLI